MGHGSYRTWQPHPRTASSMTDRTPRRSFRTWPATKSGRYFILAAGSDRQPPAFSDSAALAAEDGRALAPQFHLRMDGRRP